jgi:hypothetical protein
VPGIIFARGPFILDPPSIRALRERDSRRSSKRLERIVFVVSGLPMGARPRPVIDADEQLDSRKVRGHGLLCEHRSALRPPRISPSADPCRRRAARSHAQGTRTLVRQPLYGHQVFDKIDLLDRSRNSTHKLRIPHAASQQFVLQHAILKYIARDHLARMGLGRFSKGIQ